MAETPASSMSSSRSCRSRGTTAPPSFDPARSTGTTLARCPSRRCSTWATSSSSIGSSSIEEGATPRMSGDPSHMS
eukprot:4049170-Prymnesium_polylepis.1